MNLKLNSVDESLLLNAIEDAISNSYTKMGLFKENDSLHFFWRTQWEKYLTLYAKLTK